MGMYTNITNSDVKIIDMDGLKEYLEKCKEDDRSEMANAVEIDKKDLEFNGMDGWKIISYYYADWVEFMRDIAVFVEGTIDMDFETDDEAGWIQFKDGRVIFHCGITQWSQNTPEQLRPEIEPMSDELKARLVARKI